MPYYAYTGLPGSGKSYGVFENVIVPALLKGKRVFTNIPFNEEKVAAKCGLLPVPFRIDDIRNNPLWFQEVFQPGALLVLDEAWRLWPSGMKANQIPEPHKSFLAEHRHMVGEDGYSTEIYVVTQDLSQLAMFARDLIETTYRAVKLSAIGSSKKFRVDVYDGAVKGPKPSADRRIRQIFGQYKPEIYELYQSHTMSETGVAGDETPTDKRKNIFLGTAFKVIVAVVVLGTIFVIYGVKKVSSFYDNGGGAKKSAAPAVQQGVSQPVPPAPKQDGFLHGRDIRIAMNRMGGGVYDFTFKVFTGQSYSYLKTADLSWLGYEAVIINECLVMITGHNEKHVAQCWREQEKEGLNLVAGTASAL
jgi:zona occludens toxin